MGLDTLSPTIQTLARERDPEFVAGMWITGVLKIGGGMLALVLVRPLGELVPPSASARHGVGRDGYTARSRRRFSGLGSALGQWCSHGPGVGGLDGHSWIYVPMGSLVVGGRWPVRDGSLGLYPKNARTERRHSGRCPRGCERVVLPPACKQCTGYVDTTGLSQLREPGRDLRVVPVLGWWMLFPIDHLPCQSVSSNQSQQLPLPTEIPARSSRRLACRRGRVYTH